jgi:hypothetical protein
MFDDLSFITEALLAEQNAIDKFDIFTANMTTWHEAGVYPANQEVIPAIVKAGYPKATATVYASNLLKWAKSGQVPKNMKAVVSTHPKGHVKGKAGRKAGQGAGKTTKPAEDKAQAKPDTVPNDDRHWMQFIQDMRAKVAGRKDWPADRIAAFQDTTATLIALLRSVAK